MAKSKDKRVGASTPPSEPVNSGSGKAQPGNPAVDALPVEKRGFTHLRKVHQEILSRPIEEPQEVSETTRTVKHRKPMRGPTRRFVLLAGRVKTSDGREFKYDRDRETIIDTDDPLDEMFMNKVRAVDGPTNYGRDFSPPFDRAGLVDPPLAVRRPHGHQTQFTTDTDEDAQAELAVLREGARREDVEESAPEEDQDQGEDVTDSFEGASDAGLSVFKKGRSYHVYDVDRPGEPLNEDEYTRKDQVEKFLNENAK